MQYTCKVGTTIDLENIKTEVLKHDVLAAIYALHVV